MCSRDELMVTIGIAAEPDCDPKNAALMLKNVSRLMSENASELSKEDMEALRVAKDAAQQSLHGRGACYLR